jgi:predicted XRE-type DNA-binding protein
MPDPHAAWRVRNRVPARHRTTKANGNIFADLDFAPLGSASLQLRARLMPELIRIARTRKLTQAAAAGLLGVSQPRVSDLMRAKVDTFSSDALVEMLALAGPELELTLHAVRRVA